jgi:hypothetical protein
MTKFLPIVLSLLLAYASAQGCYPVYSPGTTYAAGSSVSESVSTISPYSWVACTPSDTCPTGWMQEGGVVTTSTHNFKCSTDAWCNNAAFAPGGIYSDLAWTKEADACSVSSPAARGVHFILKALDPFLTHLVPIISCRYREPPSSRTQPRRLRPRFGQAGDAPRLTPSTHKLLLVPAFLSLRMESA